MLPCRVAIFFFSSFGTCRTKATSHRPSLVVLKWRPSPKSSRSRVVHGPFFLVLETETICHTLKINVRNNIPWVAVKKKTLLATLPSSQWKFSRWQTTCLPAEDDESTCGTNFSSFVSSSIFSLNFGGINYFIKTLVCFSDYKNGWRHDPKRRLTTLYNKSINGLTSFYVCPRLTMQIHRRLNDSHDFLSAPLFLCESIIIVKSVVCLMEGKCLMMSTTASCHEFLESVKRNECHDYLFFSG